MAQIEQKLPKSIDEYRHNIKLLKYHLSKQTKTNQGLKYQFAKLHNKQHKKGKTMKEKHQVYTLQDTIKSVQLRLKKMGLTLGDIFRMADSNYEGQISKQQFMKLMTRIKVNLEQQKLNEMFYSIDTSLNGLIDQQQYESFIIANGGSDPKLARKHQNKALVRLTTMLKRKNLKPEQFISKFKDPVDEKILMKQFTELGLNRNQILLIMKAFDPSQTGQIRHQTFLKQMQLVADKDEKAIQNKQTQKDIQKLCVYFRENKLNPIKIYEQADVDGKEGVSSQELQNAFAKLLSHETTFQIKKWVKLININNDTQITRSQFMNSIRAFYQIDQLNKLSIDANKGKPKKQFKKEDIPVEQIMSELSIKIQDSGMTKKQLFDFIDINKNGSIDKQQLADGLKGIGMDIVFVGKVASVFDRDQSGQISLEQWLHLLGEDVQMSDVQTPQQDTKVKGKQNKNKQQPKAQTKKQNQSKKPITKPKETKKPESKQKVQSVEKSKDKQKQKIKEKQMKEKEKIKEKQMKEKQMKEKEKLKEKQLKEKQMKDKEKIKGKEKDNIKSKNSITSINNINEKNEIKSKQTIKSEVDMKKDTKKDIKKQPKNDKKFLQDKNQSQVINKTQSEIMDLQHQQQPEQDKHQDQQKIEQQNYNQDDNDNKDNEGQQEHEQQKGQQQQQKKQQHEQQQQNYENDDFQKEDQNLGKIQKDIAIMYKKSKKTILAEFQKHDQKKLGYISQKAFAITIKRIYQKISESDQKQLIEKVIESDGIVRYADWLQQIGEKYAANVKQQQKIQTKKSIDDSIINSIIDKNTKNQIKKQTKKQTKNEKSNNKELFALKLLENLTQDTQKRGQKSKQFKQLANLTIKEGTNKNVGYKISDYFNAPQEIKLLNDKYLPTAEKLKKDKKRFVDNNFPAKIQSITEAASKCKINRLKQIEWKHYKDIFKNPQLFSGGVDPNDIRQGSLGDCYFLCSLSSLAQYKNMIERLFQYYDVDNGYFLIWLCIDGEWKLFQLDGMFPVYGNQPAFSKTLAQQLWVLLLEKAYAKAYGTYEKIQSGHPHEATKDLSGAPGRTFSFSHQANKPDFIWQLLREANEKQFLMSCGTSPQRQNIGKIQGHNESITSQGIVLGHAYSILDVVQVNGQKIVQLRNPWGKTEWTGDWSDGSKKWTPELKKKLNYNPTLQDGTFWMPFKTFLTEYNTCGINYIRPSYHYRSMQQKGIKLVAAKIPKGCFTTGYIMVSRYDNRHLGLPAGVSEYPILTMISLTCINGVVKRKISEDRYKFARQGCADFINLTPDEEAIVIISVSKTSDLTIGYYGDSKIKYFEISDQCLPYMEGLSFLAEKTAKTQQIIGRCKFWMNSIGDIAFLCLKNIDKKAYNLNIEFQNPNNIRILPPQGKKTTLSIEPNQIKTVKGKIIDLSQGYSFGEFGFSFQ